MTHKADLKRELKELKHELEFCKFELSLHQVKIEEFTKLIFEYQKGIKAINQKLKKK